MDVHLIEALARAAGLERALAEFPDDLAAAAAQAESNIAGVTPPKTQGAEPWPPMRAFPSPEAAP